MKTMVHSYLVAALILALLAACQAAPPAPETASPSPTVDLGPAPIFGAVQVSFAFPEGGHMDVNEVRPIASSGNALASYSLQETSQDGLNLDSFSPLKRDDQAGEYRTARADSSLTVFIDPTAEGLLLSGRAQDGPHWVEIALNDTPVTRLYVTADWRLHYIPVNSQPAAAVGDTPLDWDVRGYFPLFPPAQRVVALRVRSAIADWWSTAHAGWRINQSHNTTQAVSLVGMQGVINRSTPSVYLVWEDEGTNQDAAAFWLGPLGEQVDVLELDLEETSALHFLLRRYRDHFKGAVVYDPMLPDTLNLATMLAGLEDRVMLSPDQLALPGVADFLAEKAARTPNAYSLPTLDGQPAAVDLRALAAQLGWTMENRIAQYQWVYDTLWPDLDPRGIGILSPGPPTSIHTPGPPLLYDPLGLAARDYLVALKLPVLWISPSLPEERELFERFLEDAPNPIPVFSFFDGQENETVDLASSYGNWVPVIPNSNTPLSSGNLSLLTAVRPEVIRYEREPDVAAILSTLGPAPVVTLWNSDGDALQILYDRGLHGGVDFIWENLDEFKFGFSLNPILADLTPLVWNYYLSTANGPSFMSGLSGAGYSSPQLMDAAELAAYLERSAYIFELTGLRSIYMIELRGEFSGDLAAAYVQALEPSGYLGAYATFLGGPEGEVRLSYPDDPHPVIRPTFILGPGRGQPMLDELLAGEPGELFFDLANSHYHQGRVIQDPEATNGQAVIFTRAEAGGCCMVVSGTNLTLSQGTYTATFRLKLPEKTGSGDIAGVQILQQGDAGQSYGYLPIRVANFAAAGEYQDFAITFTLEETTTNLELWIDYLGDEPGFASGDLVADTIRLTREGGPLLPRFAAVFIGLVGPVDSLDEDLRIMTEDFAAQGGIVLHPDDFAAALNPAFMLALAEAQLGADHPALDAPRALLAQGDYLEALVQVRQALIEGLGMNE
jgi:hypothetical protein